MGSGRVTVVLACSECGRRNYRTTRLGTATASLELSKYCAMCKRRTVHRETK
ncbi:MAG: 50S ribosomal protein L33 [Polyangiaceae bacterium]|nr:50S ribosomal protein L33 [Polyangiaceae bacterium]